ncbi:MAG: DUF3467 domain-containing protein [Solirubrobacteraceae bacterium]|nr:DUF3467 domain-containing protein [Patulibacter sp.]
MADEGDIPRYRLHAAPDLRANYANFADVTVSPYEVTLTFAHVDRTPDEHAPETPGMVVSQIIVSPQFAAELADALDDAVERYDQRYGAGGQGQQP